MKISHENDDSTTNRFLVHSFISTVEVRLELFKTVEIIAKVDSDGIEIKVVKVPLKLVFVLARIVVRLSVLTETFANV